MVFRVIGISNDWAPQPRFLFLHADSQAWGGSRGQSAFIPALSAIDAGVVPLNVRDCDRQRADGFHVDVLDVQGCRWLVRSEEHTSELQSLMRISYAVFCLKEKTNI